jgi:hypothetical protein
MASRPGTFLIYVNTASMPNLKRAGQTAAPPGQIPSKRDVRARSAPPDLRTFAGAAGLSRSSPIPDLSETLAAAVQRELSK